MSDGYTKAWGMTTVHTKVFKSNQSLVVRLPKPVALLENIREVDIVAIGNTRVISSAGKSWGVYLHRHLG
jgi:antitoxin VapB